MSAAPTPTADEKDEQIRLLRYQLDFQRAELLHLTHERDRMVYSAAWLVFRPLRGLEAKLVDAVGGLFKKKALQRGVAGAGPASAPESPVRHAPAARLLVDVTGAVKRDAGTGIQRVVKKVVEALYGGERYEIPAIAVRSVEGRLFSAHAYAASLAGKAPIAPDQEIDIRPGDRFFMLSDSWNAFEELAPLFARIRAEGGEVISCIFDLIPELHPHACHEVTPPLYDAWLRKALLESDGFLAISRTVAQELADFVKSRGLPHRPGLKIGWFHCGCDIASGGDAPIAPQIKEATAGSCPAFLCVSTIEPRKGQRVALRAFEKLWGEGVEARLVFVGRRGWFDEAIAYELENHPEKGRRLFWFGDAGDADLAYLYDHARALVLPSFAEGFGLPIVEAAWRGRPVLCSDIPVFREVGGEGAIYFRVNDPEALAGRVEDFLAGRIAGDPTRVLRASWADAARRITEVVARDDWSDRLS
ncbi:glycosyltransferase family 4 protein [Methylocystis heyeri]|uniref:Glycosyltransferase n=1 Tax=Methylocystis heyeri TaxID=391905 RepID=A0A6B8KEG3_9HYPH|nr:glycosyltransferase family 1 protein [Methylocystis heyeri]QGM46854.1 glycosyltransferase [Methylocystis heyeri]